MAFRSMIPQVFGSRSSNTAVAPQPARAKTFGAATKRPALGEVTNRDAATQPFKSGKHSRLQAPTAIKEDVVDMETDEELIVGFAALPAGVTDIDNVDAKDPQMVSEYVPDITAHMRKLEVEQGVRENYMSGTQSAIKPEMRSVLVDWLVEVHLRFKLIPETLQLTVNIMDRYLSKCPTEKSKLQLVGVTAMLIASKYEEMYPPEVRDFVWIADNTYTRAAIIALEGVMLRELDYDLGTPLPVHFLNRGIKACSADKTTETMATYFSELSLVGYDMAHFKPSEKAAASLCLARAVMTHGTSEKAWGPNLAHFMGYSFAEMKPCLDKLTATVSKVSKSKHQAVRTKFARSKFEAISTNEKLAAHSWM